MNVVDMAGRLEVPLFDACGTYALTDFLEVRQSTFAIFEILRCEKKRNITNSDLVAVGQRGLKFDFSSINKDAVFALHIERVILLRTLVETDLHVLSGDVLIKNLDWDGLIPADYICPMAERVIIAFVSS